MARSPSLARLLATLEELGVRGGFLAAFGLALVPAGQSPRMLSVYYPLLAIALLAWATLPRFRSWIASVDVLSDAPAPSSARDARRSLLVGGVLLAVALVFLEARAPLYFTQDDNFAQFAPVMIHGARSFFSGVFPSFNPYQLLGQPTTSVGTYSLTYPITYLSYGIAAAFGSPDWTLEVFCLIHVIAGYFVAQRVLVTLFGVRPWIAALSALTYVLSGYDLICGRSWYYMVPLVLWVPLTTFVTFRFLETATLRRAIAVGLVLGVLFHAGNAQMWAYTVCLAVLVIALFCLSGRARAAHLLHASIALAVMAAVAAPLLVRQMALTRDVDHHVWGGGISTGTLALFLPYPLAEAPNPNGWLDGANTKLMGHLYYSGTVHVLATLLFAAACAHRVVVGDRPRALLARPLCLLFLSFLVFLSAAFGESGLVWNAMAALPVFHKFSNPFKMLAFLTWQFAAIGAVVVTRLLASASAMWRARASSAVTAVMLLALAWHLQNARVSFHSYGDRPYPKLPSVLADATPPIGRTASVTPWRSARTGYAETLPHNLGTVYGIPALDGYDPLVSDKPESRFDRSAVLWGMYAVDTVLVAKEGEDESATKDLEKQLDLRKLGETANVRAYSLGRAKPIVFGENATTAVHDLLLRGDGLDVRVDVASPHDPVTVVFLSRLGMMAYVDGERATIGTDLLKRIVVDVPQGSHQLRIVYEPYWRFGYFLVALLTLAMAWLAKAFLSSK